MGWMTGFELNWTHRHINKIRHLAPQITANPGKKSATLQPPRNKNCHHQGRSSHSPNDKETTDEDRYHPAQTTAA